MHLISFKRNKHTKTFKTAFQLTKSTYFTEKEMDKQVLDFDVIHSSIISLKPSFNSIPDKQINKNDTIHDRYIITWILYSKK